MSCDFSGRPLSLWRPDPRAVSGLRRATTRRGRSTLRGDERRARRHHGDPAIVITMAAARILGWKRVRFVLVVCLLISLLFLGEWHGPLWTLYGRLFFVGLLGLLA